MIKGKKIINLVGPSGAGKTTLGKFLITQGIPELVSHTSRDIRTEDNEVEGISYYFTDKEKIISMDRNNELVEHVIYSGNHYALSKEEVFNKLKENDIAFVITDRNGNRHLKSVYGEDAIITIFIFVDIETLIKRLIARGDSQHDIEDRLVNIEKKKEMSNYEIADFVILNKDLKYAKQQLLSIVDMVSTKTNFDKVS